MTKEERIVRRDRMRYTKNTLSSGLALAAIVFNVFYFVSIYTSDVSNYYYQMFIGIDVVYNLLFMLIVFLSSEGVKNYKMGYSFMLLFIGVLQAARIFYIPERAHNAVVTVAGETIQVMGDKQFMWVCAWLILSAVCCLLASVTGIVKSASLASHEKSLEKKNA